jgi:hypothetical protein
VCLCGLVFAKFLCGEMCICMCGLVYLNVTFTFCLSENPCVCVCVCVCVGGVTPTEQYVYVAAGRMCM